MSRVAEVNRELKRRGRKERLVRGRGYYYFVDGEASRWYSSSVYIYRADDLSLRRWMKEFEQLSGSPFNH
jgi:hypothetical protein